MDKYRQLKPIIRDLILWNNQHNEKGYLSLCIGQDDWRGNFVDVNNNYWDYPDEADKRISTWFTAKELIDM